MTKETTKKSKKSRVRTVFKYLFLGLLLAEIVFLSAEALLPGKESAASSGAFGDSVSDILTEFSGDGIRDVRPEAVFFRRDGEEISSLELSDGKTARISLGYSPADVSVNYRETVWNSEDERVVRVQNGELCAVAPGQTRVSAWPAAFPELKKELPVAVNERIAEEFTISFADGSQKIRMEAGQTAPLYPVFTPDLPDAEIRYTVADPSVAAVRLGAVVALAPGNTTVSAVYAPVTAPERTLAKELQVTVEEAALPRVPLLSLDLDFENCPAVQRDGETLYLYAGDGGSFGVRYTPADTTERAVLFSSSDEDVLSVDGTGVFRAVGKGVATVEAYSAVNGEIVASCTLQVRNQSLGVVLSSSAFDLTPSGGDVFTATIAAGRQNARLCLEGGRNLFVKYRSDDEDVLRVFGDGTIAALRAQTKKEVAVTVTVADNEGFLSENGDLAQTFTIHFTVEKQQFGDGVSGWGIFVRKLFGHFGAFLGLGLTAGATCALFDNGTWKRRLIFFAALLLFGFTFACFTEFLQTDLFTVGRGASFADVAIDCQGYFPAALLVYTVFLLAVLVVTVVRKLRKRKK